MITVSQNLLIVQFPLTFPFNFLSISLLEDIFFSFFISNLTQADINRYLTRWDSLFLKMMDNNVGSFFEK